MTAQQAKSARRKRGFERAGSLVDAQVRRAGEARGFAVARLLTHWEEIVGLETARSTRPAKVSYAREGFGATLTVLTTGSMAPMLQMKEPQIRERINAVYGYAAISRVRFTQTAPTGFAEGRVAFGEGASETPALEPKPLTAQQAGTETIADPGLQEALNRLGARILTSET